MNKTVRYISLFLSFVFVFTALAGCGNTPAPDTDTEEQLTSAEETAAVIDIFSDSENPYKVIRPEKSTDELISAFAGLIKRIKAARALSLEAGDDWLKTGDEPGEHEILIGHTNRPESDEALTKVANNQYIICFINGKLVINAYTDELVLKAIERFATDVVENTSFVLTEDLMLTDGIEVPITSLTINGTSISEFTVIRQTGTSFSEAVERLNGYLSANCSVELDTDLIKNAEHEHEIVFGNTSRDSSTVTKGCDSCTVYYKNGKLYIGCENDTSALMAVNMFINKYISGTGDIAITLPEDGTAVIETKTYSREEYIKDPSLLPMHWAGLWEPEEHMLDYQEKLDALYCKNENHLFTVSHRGDFLYYPENSIESYISVWKMGGDCVETDLHYTKDGVCVIMHDATLTRMTNVADYLGKNGYPDSANISEWTYEQLKVLCLKSGQGGSSASVTTYKIPTLEEVLTVAKGRFFLILDKQDQWRYCDIEGIQEGSAKRYIFPLMEKTGNFESVLISYGHMDGYPFTAEMALKVQQYVYEKTGQKMLFFLRGWTSSGTAGSYASKLVSGSLTNSAILVNGAIDPTSSSWKSTIAALKKKYPTSMLGGWTIDTNGYDCEKYWNVIYDTGIRSIMSNNMFGLVQFAATK